MGNSFMSIQPIEFNKTQFLCFVFFLSKSSELSAIVDSFSQQNEHFKWEGM